MQPRFQVGDKAYYPVHGIAEVVGLEKREIGAKATHVYILRIADSGLKIIVPTDNAEAVGLRAIMSVGDVREVFSILRSTEVTTDHQTWNRRQREYMDKIKTGSAYEIAEVLRDLYLLRRHKDLSFGERRMLETARGLLVREIAIARKEAEGQIEAEIESIFQEKAA
jgi:CarD family transcriptional regulator, regulator of rRNA transcription